MTAGPVIAIAPCRALPDYVTSVRIAGGVPLVLDPAAHAADRLDELCDGLLLTGGGDIDPSRYGEPPHPTVAGVDAARDAYELDLAARALSAGLPTLGICRGLQLLNVAAGGTLVQDIPSQCPGPVDHRIPMPVDAIAHDVTVTAGSRLAGLMACEGPGPHVVPVNSRHHQAVRRLADGWVVTATAPDGVVEAIERLAPACCVAVQWHPENFCRTGEFAALFRGFVEVCRRSAPVE